jgi:eukaryotic-like serine/threonine-protein kinase
MLGAGGMHAGDVLDDRFDVLRRAGSGGMGVVYEARDRTTRGRVALKVLSHVEEGPGDRFAQEIELLASLKHPHIVGYVAHGVTPGGAPYLVMPWLEGFDLQVRLLKEALTVDETYTLARAVASALTCLHGKGLVHRDLKPSNLFLQRGRVDLVQVIDLGIARTSIPTRALTISGVLIGTPGYIAPEQARGDPQVAPAVDVFALGCVLFECLTGKRLFAGQHVMAVLAKVLLEEAPRVRELRPDAPDALDRLVHRMVSKDPALRPRDGAELARCLEDAGPPGPSVTPSRTSSPDTLTATEQRVVTVVVVVLPSRDPSEPPPDTTRAEVDPFHSISMRFGVRVHLLAERTAIALAPEGVSAADQASVLARFGRFVTETLPGASVALATGTAETGGRLPVGEAIDKGVDMVRAAIPGEGVLLDDVSAALITSRFDIRRDKKRLILEDERTSLDPARLLLGRPTSCIGRDGEIAILEGALAECGHGSGPKVVLLTAPSGAGKSRVGHEFVRRLRAGAAAPPPVFQGRGDPLHQSTPYALVAQAVRQLMGLHEREPAASQRAALEARAAQMVTPGEVARVSAFAGELVGVFFDDAGNLPLRAARQNAGAMADQIRLAFEDLLRASSRQRTVVLVLEDLQWIDNASVSLLDGALRKLAGEPLLVLGLTRPEVHERFPGLWQHRGVTEIRLPPLPPRACARLVHAVMGAEAPGKDVDRLVARSEGNAFYLEELIRAATEAGRRKSTSAPRPRREALPTTVIAVAQSRLERLEPRVRKVLRGASVFGERFSVEGVSALVGEEPRSLEPLIDSLIEQEAIVPVEESRMPGMRQLAFRHALLRAAAYETLTEKDRMLGHRLAADWLEEIDEDREVVALHWLEGGDRARAAATFAAAADVRWERAQADAAARCATRALLVGDPTVEEPAEIARRVHRLADALEASRRIDSRDVMAALDRHVTLQGDAWRSVAHAAIARALEVAAPDGGDAALVLVRAFAASALGALSDFEGAALLLAEATALAADDAGKLAQVRYSAAKVAFWGGKLGAPAEILSGAVLPADPRERLEVLLLLATATVSIDGRAALDRALDLVSRAEALVGVSMSEPHRPPAEDPVGQAHCSRVRFLCYAGAGDYARAAEAAEAAVATARRGGLRYEECADLHNAGESYLQLGDSARARAALIESSELARDLGVDRVQFPNRVLLAYLDGDTDGLTRLAESSGAAADAWHELHARYWLGRLLASEGAPASRRELLRAQDLARELEVREMADDCARALAALSPVG